MKILELKIVAENSNLKGRFKSILDTTEERSEKNISVKCGDVEMVGVIGQLPRHGGGSAQFQGRGKVICGGVSLKHITEMDPCDP